MVILLTNDDGIYAPGLTAIEHELQVLGDVTVVAPAGEQSGVGHSISYQAPLIVKEVFRHELDKGERRWGWAVEGSPADCTKLGIQQLCPRRPDLIVSGINSGFNAGINILYSGTAAAAIEGAFFGVTSVAVSLEYDEHARFDKAARLACAIIRQILAQKRAEPQLYNLNIPTAALNGVPEVCVVPMNVTRYEDSFEMRHDPWGREYFWLKEGLAPMGKHATDLSSLAEGKVTITPLDFNLTKEAALKEMQHWRFALSRESLEGKGVDFSKLPMPTLRTRNKQKPPPRES